MKKITLLYLFAALLFVGCKDDDNSVYDPYASVRPGITIYNSGSAQQSVSSDLGSAAAKLAMLMDEAKKQNTTIEAVTVLYKEATYKLHNLLFGPTTRITQEGNTYRISYFDATAGIRDNFSRQGVYLVDTKGVSLAESTEDTPWVVTLEKDPVYLTSGSGYLETTYVIESGSNTLYRISGDSYALLIEGVEAHLRGYTEKLSNWSGDFVWTTSTVADDFAFTTHQKDTYTLYGSASGRSFYSLGGATQTEFDYAVPANDPVTWEPSRTVSYALIVEGEERISILNMTEQLLVNFPSPTVRVLRELDKNEIKTTVIYNNNTVQL